MTSITSGSGTYLSNVDGALSFTEAATYKLTATSGQPETQTTTYDEVFDLSLTQAETEALLNAFTTSGVQQIYANDNITATNTFAAASGSAAFNVLKKAITDGKNANNKKAEEWLKGLLDVWIQANIKKAYGEVDFGAATASNVEAYPTDKLSMAIDSSSGVVTVDAESSATSAANTCFGTDTTLIKEIPYSNIIKYDSDADNNTISTTALPLVGGDKLLFVLVAGSQKVSMSPSESVEPVGDDTGDSLGAGFQSSESTPSKRLAFRMTMAGTAGEKIANLKA